jgi:Na+/proline symporter
MFDPSLVLLAILLYVGLLFAAALWTERRVAAGKNPVDNPLVYSLSLAVYCTAWTYYGSVGKAATSGYLFLAIYLGPTLAVPFWWFTLRRLVRIKNLFHVTSLADLISLRYGKSRGLAALATLLVLMGITPYLALQLKAVISTFSILTTSDAEMLLYRYLGLELGWAQANLGALVCLLMIVFTIAFGARRLDPTERHPGMIMAVALECMVKLVAFLAVGIFVTYQVHGGFQDVFAAFAAQPHLNEFLSTGGSGSSYLEWLSYLLLSLCAVFFLPRQFHVAVVENYRERHIATAMWMFPLYMLLINLFVAPLAMAGLLAGYPVSQADNFVLRLPLDLGQGWLALLAFLGGFSAASGMVIIGSLALATMVGNHLILPLLERVPPLAFLRRRLLALRWLTIALVVLAGYWFERQVGESYFLVNMGLISFAAMAQFAPAALGGLFWRRGSRVGALWGLGAGTLIWVYTMLVPAFARSGWLAASPAGARMPSLSWLTQGPWGLELLAPERFLGAPALDPLTGSVFWSLCFNAGLYVLGSLLFPPEPAERKLAEELAEIMSPAGRAAGLGPGEAVSVLQEKLDALALVLEQYLPPAESQALLAQCLRQLGLEDRQRLSVLQLADLSGRVETALAGSIGTAAAHAALSRAAIFNLEESEALSRAYAGLLASLRLSPLELRRRLDYHQAREQLFKRENELLVRSRQLFQEKLTSLDRLARSVAHEIRNPVTTIGGLTQRLLSQAGAEGRDTKYLAKILAGVQDLEKIVREVRAYADLPAPQVVRQDLGAFLGEVAADYRQQAEAAGVRLVLAGLAGQAERVHTQFDPFLLERALKVLVDNSLEAMPQGGDLRLTLSVDEDTAAIEVADTGPGITAEDLPYLFDPFFSTKAEAVGMSLAIARRIASDHQGDLVAVSHQGKGAIFKLTLPLRVAPLPDQSTQEARPPALR